MSIQGMEQDTIIQDPFRWKARLIEHSLSYHLVPFSRLRWTLADRTLLCVWCEKSLEKEFMIRISPLHGSSPHADLSQLVRLREERNSI